MIPVNTDDLCYLSDQMPDERAEMESALSDLHAVIVIDVDTYGEPARGEWTDVSEYTEGVDFAPIVQALYRSGVGIMPLHDDQDRVSGIGQGFYDWADRIIGIKASLPAARQFEAILHELAHHHAITVRDIPIDIYKREDRIRHEVIAESVAYLAARLLGRPASSFSRRYLHEWVGTADPQQAHLRLSRDRDLIFDIAADIVRDIRAEGG